MARLFKMEITFHDEVEPLKQIMETHAGYSHKVAFKTIDPTNIGFIDVKTLDKLWFHNQNEQMDFCSFIDRKSDWKNLL